MNISNSAYTLYIKCSLLCIVQVGYGELETKIGPMERRDIFVTTKPTLCRYSVRLSTRLQYLLFRAHIF